MIPALASAALLVAGSLAVGQAVLALCGRREPTWLAGPVGLALMLAAAAIVAGAGGRGPALAIVFACLVVASALGLGSVGLRHGFSLPALAAGGLAAILAAIPFIVAGNVGILGVGLVNDDMASHLLIADWIDERFRPEPVFIDQGYPLGPHALVAGLSTLLGASSIDVFAGVTLAIPALTALVAFGALGRLDPVPRTLCAALVAVPYMVAAYLAQEAFKEPLIALFLITFALLLPTVKSARQAIPLGVLAAGAVYVYSFPGLAWLVGTALVWGAIEVARGRSLRRAAVVPAAGLAVLALAILVIPELPRLIDFKDFRALDPDRANEGGAGNLPGQISPLTAFGIWPTSEFRLSAGAGSLPAAAFYLCGIVATAAFAVALPRWLRRYGTAIPAALLTAAALYLAARAFGTVYTSAKAISIAAPLITLITLGGLLARQPRLLPRSARPFPGPLTTLATLVALATAFSSFLILRQAPVAPETHMEELAQIRPLVEGEKLLFLGRDNFILHELRGSKPFTHVRNFYDPYFVEPNFDLEQVGSKFDFDAVEARKLARFPYVLTTRAAYASGPPPGYEVAAETPTYVLWRRGSGADTGGRVPGESGSAPGAEHACARSERRGGAAVFAAEPILVEADGWSEPTLESDSTSTIAVEVPEGRWDVSLAYDATRPVTLTDEGGYEATLPGNLDYRGTAPFYPAGSLAGGGAVEIAATVEDPPLAGRVLGAHSVAHLGALALTPAAGGYVDGAEPPYPGAAAQLVGGGEACGRYVDWSRDE